MRCLSALEISIHDGGDGDILSSFTHHGIQYKPRSCLARKDCCFKTHDYHQPNGPCRSQELENHCSGSCLSSYSSVHSVVLPAKTAMGIITYEEQIIGKKPTSRNVRQSTGILITHILYYRSILYHTFLQDIMTPVLFSCSSS